MESQYKLFDEKDAKELTSFLKEKNQYPRNGLSSITIETSPSSQAPNKVVTLQLV